jgi:hypothetical protein
MQQPQIQNIYMDDKRLNWVTAIDFFFSIFSIFYGIYGDCER